MKFRMQRPTSKALALLAALALMVAACGGDPDETQAEDPETIEDEEPEESEDDSGASEDEDAAEAAALEAGTHTFGFVAGTSDFIAFAGVPHLEGLQLAEREINAQGYLGDGVEIAFDDQDAGGEQATAVGIVNGFIGDEDVLGIACCALSSVAGAVLPIIEQDGIPWVNHAAILQDVTTIPNGFRSFPLSQPSTAEIAEVAIDAFDIGSAVVVVTADNDGMQSDKDANVEQIEAADVELLRVIDTFEEDVDFSGPATQAIADEPDAIFLAMLGNTQVLMIQELRDRGYDGPIIGNLALAPEEIWDTGGETLVGTVLPLAFFAGNEDPLVQDFVALFEEEYGRTPDIFAAQGWQVGWHLARALREGGAATREGVLEGLNGISSAETVFGNLTWDADGEPQTDGFTYVQWSPDGELVLWDGTADGLLPNINLD